MKRLAWFITFLILASFTYSTTDAQLRIPESRKLVRKTKRKTHQRFVFQIEPAISFPSETAKTEYTYAPSGHIHEYEQDYDVSVAGVNLSFLPVLTNTIVTSDSSLMLEARARITTGFWHFESDNLIPLEGGLEIGVPYLLSDNYKIIPYVGFQYGIGLSVEEGVKPEMNQMYTLRLGVDFALIGVMRFGVSFVTNRVDIDYETDYSKRSGQFKYNQIALNVGL